MVSLIIEVLNGNVTIYAAKIINMQTSPPPYFYPNYNPKHLYTKLRYEGKRLNNRQVNKK